MNRVKDKLHRGGTILVFNPDFASPALVEYAGGAGVFDAAFIDCEHGVAGFERAEEMARAARASGMTSVLRPWAGDPALITRYLDCGVGGIQFPHIEDAAAARAAVEVVRAARGRRFDDTLVIGMIESAAAVDNLPEIVAVEGLDAVVVGMADLARSLGHSADQRHAQVQTTVDRIIGTTRSSNCVAGINLHRWEDGATYIDKGVRWFTIHARTMLDSGMTALQSLLAVGGPFESSRRG